MAHLITGYAGYEHIQSADEGAFNASFFGDKQYVMQSGNEFSGSIIDNNTVRILDGDGLMYGRHFRIDTNTYEDVTVTTGTAGKNRVDLICMTYEKNADDETEKAYLQVIKGTETEGTPQLPEYTDGNILEGAPFNQMPLYKVTIEGVVLASISPMFETLPTYQRLAQIYAERFEAICEELKAEFDLNNVLKVADVVNSLTSTATGKPLSAYQGKVLSDKFGSYVAKADVVNNLVSTATDKPLSAYQGKVLSDKFGSYVAKEDVVNNVVSTATNLPLSAYQGKVLNDKFGSYVAKSDITNSLVSTATDKALSANAGRELANRIASNDTEIANLANLPNIVGPIGTIGNIANSGSISIAGNGGQSSEFSYSPALASGKYILIVRITTWLSDKTGICVLLDGTRYKFTSTSVGTTENIFEITKFYDGVPQPTISIINGDTAGARTFQFIIDYMRVK